MKYATVCSGIGAPEQAWRDLWGPPVFTSEIEPFPSAVLRHHYPDVPNHGDMTKYKEWPDYEQLGLICGGTPCQSFSVAGLRKGMDDSRGNLTLVFLGILARYRPRWFVWENVPGILSSTSMGESDFGRFLSALAELGYSCSYRVLDAQYFGVPQPRRRVFVVGYLGTDWRPSFAVLSEPQALQGNITKSQKTRMEYTRTLTAAAPCGRGDAHPIVPCWWDGKQKAQTGDAVLYKQQTMPDKNRFPALIDTNGLRFATPKEWERLQGFPDDFTLIPWRKGMATDGHRYKALGNSMAVPVVRWIGRRIQMWEDLIKSGHIK